MCCAALQVIRYSGRPISCVSCHGATADLHASDDTQGVIRLEADPVSTRSRPCFYSKQTLFLLEADPVSTRSTTARRQSPRSITVLWRQGSPCAASRKRTDHSPWMPIVRNYSNRGARWRPSHVKTTSMLSELLCRRLCRPVVAGQGHNCHQCFLRGTSISS